jgi:hypothetical protein
MYASRVSVGCGILSCVVGVILETLEISVSHSCAWTWIAMVIDCACGGSVLYVRLSGGFSWNETS